MGPVLKFEIIFHHTLNSVFSVDEKIFEKSKG